MKFRDYVTDNLWDYLEHVFHWGKYCCFMCKHGFATRKLLRQPADKPGVCEKCWTKMNRRKTGYSGRTRRLIENKQNQWAKTKPL